MFRRSSKKAKPSISGISRSSKITSSRSVPSLANASRPFASLDHLETVTADQLAGPLAQVRIVVSDQHPATRAAMTLKDGRELATVNRFDQVVRGTESVAAGLLVDDR